MKKRIKFFLTSVFLIGYFLGLIFSQKHLENFFYAQISEPLQNIPELKIPEREKKPKLEINAKSALSFKISKNREKFLIQENAKEPLPIASLTKLMTAIVIFEDGNYDFSDFIKISKEAASQEDVPQYGNLKEGEGFRMKTLLNLMLVYSSNDAAYALAEKIGIENFVEKMNQKAKELELENTFFVNPTGLNKQNGKLNYSTADEIVELTKYILREYPEIFNITLEGGPYPVEKGIFDISLPENKKIIGGKTGYIPEAGGCMVFVFENENENIFINVILGAPSLDERAKEMQKLIDWLNS
ncbi:hypothetical protein AMJ49_03645 [Parcubacteria bacterium DG_74_2]|nr:MAG: hypothetical protein AMJ49_03645 [Parcubacteria bacterium DG_74_2]